MELLLRHGADPSVKTGLGKTPLDYAEQKGYSLIAEHLRSPRRHLKGDPASPPKQKR